MTRHSDWLRPCSSWQSRSAVTGLQGSVTALAHGYSFRGEAWISTLLKRFLLTKHFCACLESKSRYCFQEGSFLINFPFQCLGCLAVFIYRWAFTYRWSLQDPTGVGKELAFSEMLCYKDGERRGSFPRDKKAGYDLRQTCPFSLTQQIFIRCLSWTRRDRNTGDRAVNMQDKNLAAGDSIFWW